MSSCLLINASYEPLTILSWRRAVVLVLNGEADVLEESDGLVRSPSISMQMPLVIRLRTMVKVPFRARVPLNRRAVLARDRGRCAYHGQYKNCSGAAATIDHVVPRSRGGRHEWENVVAACRPCNARKDDRLLSEIGWTLDYAPHAPTGTQWLLIGLAAKIDETWRPYLGLEPALATV